jgi:hypothetical protein
MAAAFSPQQTAGQSAECEIMRESDPEADFAALQARLPGLFARLYPDPLAPRTVLVVPSLSLDKDVLAAIAGLSHYEERMLGMLMLLRLPRTRLIYVTSEPIPPAIIDYYLHMLQGVPSRHARERLTLLACHDGSQRPVTEKILERPRLIERLRGAIGDTANAHMSCFVVSAAERQLALRLDIPIFGCRPELARLGTKSGGRQLLRAAGLAVPNGIEDLNSAGEIAEALVEVKRRDPALRRAVVKLNDGCSGEGNAVFRFDGAPDGAGLKTWVAGRLPLLAFESPRMSWELYQAKTGQMGAIVEAFIEGEVKRSPSAQFRIDPRGEIDMLSTHDQFLGGPSGQVFLGCRFPADSGYRLAIQDEAARVAPALRTAGVLGRVGIDFITVREGDKWRSFAIEINIRKGGTTHPYLMLQFLTGGRYDASTGNFLAPSGQERFYTATDNLESPAYRGLTPPDLVDIAVLHGLHYDGTAQEGVVFHLIGALSEFGKLGLVCIGRTPDAAEAFYARTIEVLNAEVSRG